jgi:hypothetical protein
MKTSPDKIADFISLIKYFANKYALKPDNMNVKIQIILYAAIRPNSCCKGMDIIALNGETSENARLTPVG